MPPQRLHEFSHAEQSEVAQSRGSIEGVAAHPFPLIGHSDAQLVVRRGGQHNQSPIDAGMFQHIKEQFAYRLKHQHGLLFR